MKTMQEYTAEFRELAEKRVTAGRAAGSVAKEPGLIEQTLRDWVKALDAGMFIGPGAKEVGPEQMRLTLLRAEKLRLKRENENLIKAAAYRG